MSGATCDTDSRILPDATADNVPLDTEKLHPLTRNIRNLRSPSISEPHDGLHLLSEVGQFDVDRIDDQDSDDKRALAEFILGENGVIALLDLDGDVLPSYIGVYKENREFDRRKSYAHFDGISKGFSKELRRTIAAAEFTGEDRPRYQEIVSKLVENFRDVELKLHNETDDVDGYIELVVHILQSGYKHFGDQEEYIDFYFEVAEKLSVFDEQYKNRVLAYIPKRTGLEIAENFGFMSSLKKSDREVAKYFADKWFESHGRLEPEVANEVIKNWSNLPIKTCFPIRPGQHLVLLDLFRGVLKESGVSRDDPGSDHNSYFINDYNKFIHALSDFSTQEAVISPEGTYNDEYMEQAFDIAREKFRVNNLILGALGEQVDTPDEIIDVTLDLRMEDDKEFRTQVEEAKSRFKTWENEKGVTVEKQIGVYDKYIKSHKLTQSKKPDDIIFSDLAAFIYKNRRSGERYGDRSTIGFHELVNSCVWGNDSGLTDIDFQVLMGFFEELDSDEEVRDILREYGSASRNGYNIYPGQDNERLINNLLQDKDASIDELRLILKLFENLSQTDTEGRIRQMLATPSDQVRYLLRELGVTIDATERPQSESSHTTYNNNVSSALKVLSGLYNIPEARESLGITFTTSQDDVYKISNGRLVEPKRRENCYANFQIAGSLDIEFERGDQVVIGGPTGSGKTTALKVLLQSIFPGNRSVPNGNVSMPIYQDRNTSDGVWGIGLSEPDPTLSLAEQSMTAFQMVADLDIVFADEPISGGTDLAAAALEYLLLMKRKKGKQSTIVTTHHVEELGVLDRLVGGNALRHLNIIPISHESREGMSSSFGVETFSRIGTESAADLVERLSIVRQQVLYGSDEIEVPSSELNLEREGSTFGKSTFRELGIASVYGTMLSETGNEALNGSSNRVAERFVDFLERHAHQQADYFIENIHGKVEDALLTSGEDLESILIEYAERIENTELAKRALVGTDSLDYYDKFRLYNYLRELATPNNDSSFIHLNRENEIASKMERSGLSEQDLIVDLSQVNDETLNDVLSKLYNEIQFETELSKRYPTIVRHGKKELDATATLRDQLLVEIRDLFAHLLNEQKSGNRSTYLTRVEEQYSSLLNPNIVNIRTHLGESAKEILEMAAEDDHLTPLALASLYGLSIKRGYKGQKVFHKPIFDDTRKTPLTYQAGYNLQLMDRLEEQYVPIRSIDQPEDETVAQVKIGHQRAGKSASLITEAGIVAHTLISGYCPAEGVKFKSRPESMVARVVRSIGTDNYSQYETEARKLDEIYRKMISDPNTWVFIDEISNGVDKSTKQAVMLLFLAQAVENNTPLFLTTLLDETSTLKKLQNSDAIQIAGYDRKQGNYQAHSGDVGPDTIDFAYELGLLDESDYELALKLYDLLKMYYTHDAVS